MLEVPFPAAVYVKDTGENLTMRSDGPFAKVDGKRELRERLSASAIERTAAIDDEFNLGALEPPGQAVEGEPVTPTRVFSADREDRSPTLSVVVTTYRRPEGFGVC